MTWANDTENILAAALQSFGEDVVYTPVGGNPIAGARGVFRARSVAIDPDTGAQVNSENPVLGVQFSNLGWVPKQNDSVVVRGVSYRVARLVKDGEGGGYVILNEI